MFVPTFSIDLFFINYLGKIIYLICFCLAWIPKYIDKPSRRITSNELLFPRISISISILIN